MARYTGPKNKKARRFGIDLGLKSNPKSLERRIGTPPGAHGRKGGNRKVSDYGMQLAEKQKAKILYGIMERQFKKYYIEASKNPLATGEVMLSLLERRLDNCIYRLGFVPTRAAARQLVSHGNVTINGKKLNIPSYKVRVGDIISLTETATHIPYIKSLLANKDKIIATWFDKKAIIGKVARLPVRSDIIEAINEQLIVEFYSR
ncbi:30S ribosomal protein S4 [Candidatus Collierbacteria bacterium CG10_big_fil_rev_8_21_14_0_10_44_9]|uniref:Small ribosomal subunit protein uS4 n=1 Tax=Candidatus Collierbacteria bacterium CG10_big_fil_rev_8_21_14_0_10_44_9 TaxID=1974535 RepID=A0A2H0VLT0_9BACT|nr:MAG: 30S ribosomal protein S4 [Candidatus Collierbacteria bacterium CG10_big_fil_rev_8_21_14_0_10_44_9]